MGISASTTIAQTNKPTVFSQVNLLLLSRDRDREPDSNGDPNQDPDRDLIGLPAVNWPLVSGPRARAQHSGGSLASRVLVVVVVVPLLPGSVRSLARSLIRWLALLSAIAHLDRAIARMDL